MVSGPIVVMWSSASHHVVEVEVEFEVEVAAVAVAVAVAVDWLSEKFGSESGSKHES